MYIHVINKQFSSTHHVIYVFKICLSYGIQGGPQIGNIFCTPQPYQILTNFQTYFTVRIRRKLVIILSLKIAPHLKCVATQPC